MFTDIDFELYPDDCEVVEISPRNHFYLIQKNGSSSLRKHAVRNHGSVHLNQDIKELTDIQILIRNPLDRYISGVHTYVTHLLRDHPGFDKKTCVWMATRYQFLNRHYLPQFLWLVNLARFLGPDTKLHLSDFKDIKQITDIHDPAGPPLDDETRYCIMEQRINGNWEFIDQVLEDNIGKHFTWQQLLDVYQAHPSKPLQGIQTRSRILLDVLS